MQFAVLFLFLSLAMQGYFFLAARLNIIDKPNARSSHTLPTIRGGGVIFFIGLFLWFITDGFRLPYLTAGAFLIALISFMDDLRTQHPLVRLIFHITAFSLMGLELSLFVSQPAWLIVLIFIIGIGTLNAFNFMDGINGMTGCYALISLASMFAIDYWMVNFTDAGLLAAMSMSVGVFLFYNYRKRARCFAGDVGSVALAFILVFLLLQLILATGDFGWFILFAVYGVDSVGTIVYRLIKRENIFKAHRSHMYQYLANELGYSHLVISAGYALLQVIINVLVLVYIPQPSFMQGILLVLFLGLPYVWIRERMMVRIGKAGILTWMFNKQS